MDIIQALELACLRLCHQIPDDADKLQECYLAQAKTGDTDEPI